MEVLNPRIVSPDSSLLKEIQNIINRGEGLNAAKDVEVALLTQVNFFFFHKCTIAFPFPTAPFYVCCILRFEKNSRK